ncbi:hypothetical protein [Rhizobium leguminosarum]|uniref:hypothetical protein n=1 Tax=Rhizobium leguminosarum TaxID=384 RepID=UPI001C91EA92|nr:hypothetical protein [Rhizobium leguminosarum]
MVISFNDRWADACATLTVGDGDTIKCGGQNMPLLGKRSLGFGIDTPEMYAKWMKERKLSVGAKESPKETAGGARPESDLQRRRPAHAAQRESRAMKATVNSFHRRLKLSER